MQGELDKEVLTEMKRSRYDMLVTNCKTYCKTCLEGTCMIKGVAKAGYMQQCQEALGQCMRESVGYTYTILLTKIRVQNNRSMYVCINMSN